MNNRSHRALLTVGALTIAVLAVSSSGPLIAYAAAPALAIAFWRNGLAAAALTPVALGPRRAEYREVIRGRHRRAGVFCVLAGVALAAHFATWMPAVQLGSVATATALVATQPVWQGLIAAVQGRRPSTAGWVGIALAVAGAAWATGADLGVSRQAVLADVLAVLGGIAAAVYTALGEQARAELSTTTYTWICYGTCAAILLIVCLAFGVPLVGYEAATWAAILALVFGAQLLGHSMFSYALKRVSATTISVVILLEVPGAALIAWWWLAQQPRPAAVPGLLLILLGVVAVVQGGARRTPPTPTVVDDLQLTPNDRPSPHSHPASPPSPAPAPGAGVPREFGGSARGVAASDPGVLGESGRPARAVTASGPSVLGESGGAARPAVASGPSTSSEPGGSAPAVAASSSHDLGEPGKPARAVAAPGQDVPGEPGNAAGQAASAGSGVHAEPGERARPAAMPSLADGADPTPVADSDPTP